MAFGTSRYRVWGRGSEACWMPLGVAWDAPRRPLGRFLGASLGSLGAWAPELRSPLASAVARHVGVSAGVGADVGGCVRAGVGAGVGAAVVGGVGAGVSASVRFAIRCCSLESDIRTHEEVHGFLFCPGLRVVASSVG